MYMNEELQQLHIMVPAELLERLKRVSKRDRRSLSETCRISLEKIK
jgi:cytidylate kinase